jgi:hypothetical protein
MDKKALMFSLIILMIPVLYTISAVTATYDPSGRYSFVKGCEFGHADYWATFENQASDLNLGWARIPLKWKDAIYNSPPYSLKLDSPEYEKFILGVTKAKSMGLKVIVTIKDVPDVFKDPGLAGFTSTPMSWPNECGRISETRIVTRTPDTGIDYLGKFIVDVLRAYPNNWYT